MNPSKPDFQRPANSTSSLIANGWIEQQRRSKMRLVWKEVLASLVAGRQPGEETTLWIQREVFNPSTGKKELEALQQIPVKLMERCTYLNYTPDHRFTLKIFNGAEEIVFRCQSGQAATNWVQTLNQESQKARGRRVPAPERVPEEEKKETSPPARMSVSELRAICHGAGINTVGMERQQLERAASEVLAKGTFFPTRPNAPQPIPVPQPVPQPQAHPFPAAAPASGSELQPPSRESTTAPPVPPVAAPSSEVISISELRAICHGSGINTAGMERQQLELAAKEVQARGTYFPPPNATNSNSAGPPPQPIPPSAAPPAARSSGTPQPIPPASTPNSHLHPKTAEPSTERMSISELRAICHGSGINTAGMERQQLEWAAKEVRKRGTYFDPPKSSTPSHRVPHSSASVPDESEAARRRQAEEKARHDQYNRKMAEEEHRRRMMAEQEQRKAAEQQDADQRRRYAEQQAAWQKQQQEEENRRRMAAEQLAAEQRRRHEEAVRQQQQWQQQQQQHWQKQQQEQWNQHQAQQQQRPPHQAQTQPQQTWPPNGPQQRPHPQQQQQGHQPSAASEKYAKMANASDGDGQAAIAITRIKHDILVNRALQPPQLQMLRPMDALITTIHKVFPPALGVSGHEYFTKWKPLGPSDVRNDAGTMDEERLKKSVRKIRFFLHPDKLPKDLNPEQAFMVKMLWDVTSDAWEEFEKRKEDLDWIK